MSCPTCRRPPETWVSVTCGHIICEQCVRKHIQQAETRRTHSEPIVVCCPLCNDEIDRTNIRKVILPRELQDLTSNYKATSLNLERSRLLHKTLSKRIKASSKQAARLDSELLNSRQTHTELETTITNLQAQLDEITAQFERARLDLSQTRIEREAEVARLKAELQTTTHQARTQSTVASALGLRSLVLEDELVEKRVDAERWQARYEQLVTDIQQFAIGRFTPSGSLEGGSSRRQSGNSDSVSNRRRSSASSTPNSYATPRSIHLLSPLPLPLQSPTPSSRHSIRSVRSTRSTHLYPSPPHSPPPAAAPNHTIVTVAANPKPKAPCVTDPYTIPECTSTVHNGHRWMTKGSNGSVRKYTCTGCEIVVKEKKAQRDGVSVWETVA
ncbi:hypothetical protein QCA50_004176 [Cerrena zonata]|uniref:RING-type domain-containing protein n=1 Tax=Cerrena zonata TaxID=2478898 RepID=A0AAW0GIC2_9APHY